MNIPFCRSYHLCIHSQAICQRSFPQDNLMTTDIKHGHGRCLDTTQNQQPRNAAIPHQDEGEWTQIKINVEYLY